MKKTFIFLLTCGLRCFGAEDCTLTVRVLDEVGQPVSNATILVSVISARGFNAGKHSSDYTDYTAQTGENGVANVPFKCFNGGDYEWYVCKDDCYCPGVQRGSFDAVGRDCSPEAEVAINTEKAKIAAGTGGSWLLCWNMLRQTRFRSSACAIPLNWKGAAAQIHGGSSRRQVLNFLTG